MRPQGQPSFSGFTLIELVVVVVVIGLIVGAIVIGQQIIRQSALRAALNEIQLATDAAGTFQRKYRALPGDFSRAEENWGAAAGCAPPGCLPRKATVNGNGNGIIQGTIAYTGGTTAESYLFWQHLANAGMTQGAYSGDFYDDPDPSIQDMGIGVNVPKLAITGVTLMIFKDGTLWGDGVTTDGPHKIYLTGKIAQWLRPAADTITVEEAAGIDAKMDDGMPGSGSVEAAWVPGYVTSCYTSPSQYNITNSAARCALAFHTPF